MESVRVIKPLVKRAAQRIGGVRAVKAVLQLRTVRRILGSTPLYPDWERGVRIETAKWKSANPDWVGILQRDSGLWESARAAAANGPRVLIAVSAGGFSAMSIIDSLMAVALTLRGARVHILLCDEHLPACFIQNIRNFPEPEEFAKFGPSPHMCDGCFSQGYAMFRALGLPLHRHSELISKEQSQKAYTLSSGLPVSQIKEYRLNGMAVGEHAVAGALRFYGRGDLEGEPFGEAILRRYFHASLLAAYEIHHLLNAYSFACVSFHHGIYVPHGLFNEAARQQNVRAVAWSPAYRKRTFIFSHGDTYHHTMLSEPTTHWDSMLWTPEMEAEILAYLKSRWYGTHDWISFQGNAHEDTSIVATELGIDFSKPCIGMLTNVMWDAQLHYPANAFPGMLEWVLRTIQYFASRTDLQLIIRVHPAELRGSFPSRQPIIAEIKRAFPVLPRNVFLISPENPMNTYRVMLECDSVIIYGTKTGVELTSMGIPVIVAGEAWIRNKGLTLDANSPDEYFKLLDRLPLKQRLSETITQRARKYAYHFFFRRMIPLPCAATWPSALQLSGLDDLLPGRSVGLDVICNGTLKGEEFIYPAELHPEPDERIHLQGTWPERSDSFFAARHARQTPRPVVPSRTNTDGTA